MILADNMAQHNQNTDATKARISQLESAVNRLTIENDRLKKILSFEANTLAGELLDAEDSLDQSNRDLRSLLNNMPAMIGYWDKNLRNRFGNAAYVEWFGDAAAAMSGKHIREVIGEERYQLNLPYIKAALRGERQEFERAILSPDGKQTRYSLAQYLPDIVDGQVLGFYAMVTDITSTKHVELAMRDAQRLGGVGSFHLNIATDRWTSSEVLDDILGIDAGYMRTADGWAQLVHCDERDQMLAYWHKAATHKTRFERDYRIVRAHDGAVRWVYGLGNFACNERGESVEFFGSILDITERKLAEEAQRIASIAFETQQGMLITNAAKVILQVNRAFTEITGYSAAEAVGQTPRLLRSGRHDRSFYFSMWESINRTGSWQGEIWNRRKNGNVYPETLRINTVRDAGGEISNYVAAFSDSTSYKAAEEQIQSLAFSDPLTGLPNRQHLIVLLQQLQLARTQRPRQDALLLVGLDQLKNLNETIGYESSNRLLQSVAQRLGDCTRKGDTLVRLGGNAFVVLLQNLSLLPQQATSEAETVAGKILLALNQPYNIGSSDVHCSASIGITLVDNATAQDADVPLNQAELAMRHAKAAGRNEMRFFAPQMQAEVNARADLERGLREALLNDQFVLHYQAQVTSEGRVFGSEALLRWKHPLRGMVSPAEFIPVAEECGLILPIGNWALETACRQLALWAGKPETADLTLAVNVSAHQFHQAEFVDQVLAALERTGAKAQRLKLELTESMLVTHVEGTIAKMNALKARGIGFSLDDFGTGFSSLAYLKRLPLYQLKIDQSFVRHIVTDPGDAEIVKMVIALAHSMGLSVIAEGVELEAQRNALTDLGCHNYQGYLFSRPLPVHEFEAFVAQA